MTNPLYPRAAATALVVLQKFGTLATLVGPPKRQVYALRLSQMERTLGDSGVMVGDWKYLLAATTTPDGGDPASVPTEPIVTERFVDGEEEFVVIYQEPIKPADVVLAWYIYVRMG